MCETQNRNLDAKQSERRVKRFFGFCSPCFSIVFLSSFPFLIGKCLPSQLRSFCQRIMSRQMLSLSFLPSSPLDCITGEWFFLPCFHVFELEANFLTNCCSYMFWVVAQKATGTRYGRPSDQVWWVLSNTTCLFILLSSFHSRQKISLILSLSLLVLLSRVEKRRKERTERETYSCFQFCRRVTVCERGFPASFSYCHFRSSSFCLFQSAWIPSSEKGQNDDQGFC